MNSLFMKRTTIDEKVFKRNKSKDWYFSTDDQIKYGLVDGIVTSISEIL